MIFSPATPFSHVVRSSPVLPSLLVLSALLCPRPLSAQPAEKFSAAASAPSPSPAAALPPIAHLGAQPGEKVMLENLRGIKFVGAANQVIEAGVTLEVADVSDVSLLREPGFQIVMRPFLGHPASFESLQRLVFATRTFLEASGYPFNTIYLPRQDITGGTVQVVVLAGRRDDIVKVEGAKYFSESQYVSAIRQPAGEPLSADALKTDLDWLNRNPFRHVTSVARPGEKAGSTELNLRVDEQRPITVNASYDNTGTRTTGEDRVSAGFQWGNALGRGDLFSYRFSGDPALEHLRSHSGGYTAFLPWRHLLSLQGAWSTIDSAMPAPFAQRGTSWQVGARYEIPLKAPREGWTQNLSFTADFKYSDNNLEFAAIPVTNNVTHIVQFGATYGFAFPALGGRNSVSVSGFASPGGLTSENKTRAFEGSRHGAKADYAYGKLSLSHQRALPHGFSWSTTLDAQLASGALLGSEQLNGGGAYAVRGYEESSAFGDEGVVITNELHAPGFALFKGRDSVDLFAFVDAASLNFHVAHDNTDLRSAGVGVNYQFGRHFTARAVYGYQLKQLDHSTENSRVHVSATMNW